MRSQENDFEKVLLPKLRCTSCFFSNLQIVPCSKFFILSEPVEYLVFCPRCGETFPITNDFIPIMWSKNVRDYLEGNSIAINTTYANIKVYDSISDNYYNVSRMDTDNEEIANRIRYGVQRLVNASERTAVGNSTILHLDFGCGPGYVLEWLNGFGFKQIGLDLSLKNLRNSIRNTGALVVCGDATCMPFNDKLFDIVTESSVLHHVENWKDAIRESCRTCKKDGSILLDSEPSKDSLDWSALARIVYRSRFYVYPILSRFLKEKYIFRDSEEARMNLLAEVHNQPGTGFDLNELRTLFSEEEFFVEIILSPNENLQSRANPSWKSILLNALSGHNPWNIKYGTFSALAKPKYTHRLTE